MRPDAIRDAGLRELGVHARLRRVAFHNSGQPRTHAERQRLLVDYKAELKKDKKRLALELHPDVNRDLPAPEQAARTEKFKMVTRAIDFVLELDVRPPQPVMRQRQFMIVIAADLYRGFQPMTNTTTTTNIWGDITR